MIEVGQILKQALTPGHNEHPTETRYEFSHYTLTGHLSVYTLKGDGTRRQNKKHTYPAEFLEPA